MRRLLLTGDWHLNDNPRDAYRWGAVEQIAKLARKHAITDMFVLGDLTDKAGGHSDLFVNRTVELLARLASSFDVHILRGNHDASDPAVPFFRFVNAIKGCRFITEVEHWLRDDYRVMLIPNGCWPTPLHADGFDAVYTHHTFAGAQGEHDFRLHGLRLPLSDVPIFSGDVHVPQRQGTVTYIGAPTLIKFGDSYQPRVLLVDVTAGSQPLYRSFSIVGPTKRLVEVVAYPDGRIAWPRGEVNKGDLVKVRVSFEGEIPSLAHLRADVGDHIKRLGGVLHAIDAVDPQRTTATPRRPVSRSDTDLVRQYASAHHLNKDVTKAGLDIVKGDRAQH